MMRRRCLALLVVLWILGTVPIRAGAQEKVYELRNGRWFDGAAFVSKTMFVEGSILRERRPARASARIEIVELAGRFVIPPLGEAHNHWVEANAVDEYIESYLRDGVFYVRDQANLPDLVARFRDKVNRPESVDFVTALKGFTGPGGHPLQVADQLVALGVFPEDWPLLNPGGAAYVVETEEDVARQWPDLLEAKPAFVKVFLLYSEEHEKLRGDDAFRFRRGVDPKLVPGIVRRAHAAGLQVSAHVYTVGDFRAAVAAGVDEIAHLPGTGFEAELGNAHFVLTDGDARTAARAGVRIVTTLGWMKEMEATMAEEIARRRREIVVPNLRALKQAGARLLVGSDQFRQSSLPEVELLSTLGVFTNAELLRIACETTPRAIFPDRRIGELRDGFEASFLVLERDPIADIANLRSIRDRFKQGRRLGSATAAAAPPARFHPAMAFDERRGRAVLFGGMDLSGGLLGDTWIWDGASWTETAASGPAPRFGHAVAFDRRRNRVVLFGGTAGSDHFGDTWEWDGTAWARVASSGPSARGGAQMAYDSRRGRTVLFGGADFASGRAFGDTWEWDGRVWTRSDGQGPAPRFYHGMAFDSARGEVVLFGGNTTEGPLNLEKLKAGRCGDTWLWNGRRWRRASSRGPSPRDHHAMAFDRARARTVLFGGWDGSYLGDTWVWDGQRWRQAATEGPPLRGGRPAAAYDPARRQTLLFGGGVGGGTSLTPTAYGDTWRWDGRTWRPALSSGAP